MKAKFYRSQVSLLQGSGWKKATRKSALAVEGQLAAMKVRGARVVQVTVKTRAGARHVWRLRLRLQAMAWCVSEDKVSKAKTVRARQWTVTSGVVDVAPQRALARLGQMEAFALKVAVGVRAHVSLFVGDGDGFHDLPVDSC